jgi:hypothetical protein
VELDECELYYSGVEGPLYRQHSIRSALTPLFESRYRFHDVAKAFGGNVYGLSGALTWVRENSRRGIGKARDAIWRRWALLERQQKKQQKFISQLEADQRLQEKSCKEKLGWMKGEVCLLAAKGAVGSLGEGNYKSQGRAIERQDGQWTTLGLLTGVNDEFVGGSSGQSKNGMSAVSVNRASTPATCNKKREETCYAASLSRKRGCPSTVSRLAALVLISATQTVVPYRNILALTREVKDFQAG